MKFGIKNVMEKKARDEDKKGCSSRKEVGENPVPECLDVPPGDAVAMPDDDNDDGHGPEVFKRTKIHQSTLKNEWLEHRSS
jgi:hypothetical protein